MSDEARLEYAPRPPVHQRRSSRTVLIVFCIFAILASSYVWLPILKRHVLIMYWQHRCLTSNPGPGHVIYEYFPSGNEFIDSGMTSAWRELHEQMSGIAEPRQSFPMFLHEMLRPDGSARLVHVYSYTRPLPIHSGQELGIETYVPGSLGRIPQWRQADSFHFAGSYPSATRYSHLKIFAGQPDPVNPSHMTINYEVDGHPNTLDGWLDNNDQLLLVKRP